MVVILQQLIVQKEQSFEPSQHISDNGTEIINLTLKNNVPAIIEITDIEILVDENYSLREADFVKAQHFANGNGGIRGYEQENKRLYLTNVHIYTNANGTISLVLRKNDDIKERMT
jgi:hypothetical protein